MALLLPEASPYARIFRVSKDRGRLLIKAGSPEKAILDDIRAKAPGPTFVKPKESLDGETTLGKTDSGKPVYASGAEAGKYSPKEHGDAARLHMAAHRHHETQSGEHAGKAGGKAKDWRIAEGHEKDKERHGALADHHHEVARNHLAAAGHGSSVGLGYVGGRLQLGVSKPHGKEEQAGAKKFFEKRTHRDHPGGLTDRDRAAYRQGSA